MFSNPMDPASCFIDIQAGIRRHRSAGLGGDAAADVPPLLRAQGLSHRGPRRVARRSCRHQERVDQGRRRLRVRLPAHRGRRAPARAQEPVRFERAPAHVVRERVRLSGSRRLDRGRDQSGRPAHRHVSRVGRRRPAHQQDRLRGADHAPADEHRRPVPERPLAAPQPRRGDGDAEVEALRARAAQAPGGAAEARGLEDRHRLGSPDPLVRARPVADQGSAHQLRSRQHAGGARRRSRRFHRGEPEAGRRTPP